MKLSPSLSLSLNQRQRKILDRPKRAAVLVPLIEDDLEPRLLLTRRVAHLKSHQGEVAFPGGFFEPEDQSLENTALREALEEIALPKESVKLIGLHDDLFPVSAVTAVTPVVGVIQALPELIPNPNEVAHIFTIPIKELVLKDRWELKWKEWENKSWPIYYFQHQGEVLWGMSAYITLLTLHYSEFGAPVDISWFLQRGLSS
jgi:8-oxo-dGTP pyrophosphatase MutT (NUDIX family)